MRNPINIEITHLQKKMNENISLLIIILRKHIKAWSCWSSYSKTCESIRFWPQSSNTYPKMKTKIRPFQNIVYRSNQKNKFLNSPMNSLNLSCLLHNLCALIHSANTKDSKNWLELKKNRHQKKTIRWFWKPPSLVIIIFHNAIIIMTMTTTTTTTRGKKRKRKRHTYVYTIYDNNQKLIITYT